MDEVKTEKVMLQKRGLVHTLCFLLGFSVIFIALGYGTSFIGSFFTQYHEAIRQFGAIMLILFGLITAGVFQPKFMMKERRIHFKRRPEGFIGSVLIGLAFAAGWSPCSGDFRSGIFAGQYKSFFSSAVYVFICSRICDSFSCSFIFYYQNELDSQASAAYHENRRHSYDSDRGYAVF